LEERDRAVFARLSSFAGTFDAAAVAAVTADDDLDEWAARESLAHLVRRSMVVSEPRDSGVTRYWLLETLRQYGRERLETAGTTDDWKRRHATYYADQAEQLCPALISATEMEARRQLVEDLDNFRAAFSWAIERESQADAELGLRIVAAVSTESIINVG